ncbi:hypothetical protein [Alteromonas sp. RKMC-009]|uniref:hypothetical protein n=1 Tax=Alteromonas sp. RKMC-009 TaxID=2267264 RepID=UPI000E676C4F|nr:hypothetical protein [Alteromonas sp. RKMC-009]AYA64305.1 hypothetical protein DS731_10020 [Alteromonas sp. RKMC-009]
MSQMNTRIDLVDHQRYVEKTFSKKSIEKVIVRDLTSDPDIAQLISDAADAVDEWRQGDYFPKKNYRLSQLAGLDFDDVVLSILVHTCQITEPKPFTEVFGQVAGVLRMDDKVDGIKTAAEIMAVITEFGFYDLIQEEEYGQWYLVNNLQLEETTVNHINRTKYLPPMVVSPNEVMSNYDNALLTEKSSMILGKGTYHDGDICLDSLNTFNQVPLCLNQRLLTQLSETPKNPEKMSHDTKRQWNTFVKESYGIYRELIQLGNRFWLTHKYDKRGRTYSQGYHVNTQGNKFRKAIIEFADKEVIE